MVTQDVTELVIRAKNLTQQAFSEAERALKGLEDRAGATGKGASAAFGPIGRAVGDISSSFSSLNGVMGGLAIGKVATDFLELTGHLNDMAARTEVSTTELQRLSYAGDTVGVTLDDIIGGIGKMQANLGGENDGAIAALTKLGLSFDDLKGLDPGQQFEEIAAKLAAIQDPSERARLAMDLFGRGGVQLLPLLRQNLKDVGDEAERVGAVLSQDVIDAGDQLGDLYAKLKASSRSFVAEGLRPLLDTIKQMNDPGELARWEKFKQSFGVNATIREWRDVSGWFAAIRDTVNGIKVPPSLEHPPAPLASASDFGLKPVKLNPKELNELYEQLDAERRAFNDANRAADQHAQAIQAIRDKLSGDGAIKAAREYVEALQGVRDVSHLTEEAQADIRKTMQAAIDVFVSAGRTIPPEIQRIYDKVHGLGDLIPVIQGLSSEFDRLGESVHLAMLQVPDVKTVSGLAGLTSLPGEKLGPLTLPKSPGFLGGLFGSPQQFGQQMAGSILGAIQGGGSPVNAAAGLVGSKLGAKVASELGSSLLKDGAGMFSKALGGVLNSALPVVGSLIGPLASSLWNHFFGTAGRDAIKDFAQQVTGSTDLNKMHVYLQQNLDPQEAERFWVLLTQGTGRNNAKQAAANIEQVTAAIEAHKHKVAEDAAAVQAAADQASAAQQAAVDAAKGKVQELDDQIKSLQASVDAEAPEEEMGIIERQQRAKLEDLKAQREEAAKTLEELTRKETESLDKVAEAIDRLPDELAIRLKVSIDKEGTDTGEVPAHDIGAYVREDHTARVHAGEIIGPVDFIARAMRQAGAGAGGDVHITVPVHVDGREIARVNARYQPQVLAAYGVR